MRPTIEQLCNEVYHAPVEHHRLVDFMYPSQQAALWATVCSAWFVYLILFRHLSYINVRKVRV